VVSGHGGHAALWTGILAPTYAPDVTLDGVAALAPAGNLPSPVENPLVVKDAQDAYADGAIPINTCP
jgi:hypothetical protein